MDEPVRWPVAALVGAVVVAAVAGVAVLGSAGVSGSDAGADGSDTPCIGTVKRPASNVTVVSVQGARGGNKKPARLVAIGPEGRIRWVHTSANNGVVWSYDVDPMANGNLFVTTTVPGDTVVYEFDPESGRRVWAKRFDAKDTHDADLTDGGREIVLANMRNTGEDEEGDRIFVYDRTQDEITWQWRFENHGFPRNGGGNYTHDWTHVNDVDVIDGNRLLVSPRNFDQVLVIDRTTGEIEMRLGRDDAYRILKQQHNPDYLAGENGTPTVVVGDSGNNRVVEYARVDGAGPDGEAGQWTRTWRLAGGLAWPRDADRLPNGNTLVTDSRNHRVLEVTPEGEIVWEVYVPWLPYEAERLGTGDGSNGPTIREQGATGAYRPSGSAGLHEDPAALEACAAHIGSFPRSTAAGTPDVDRDGPLSDLGRGGPLSGVGVAAVVGAVLLAAVAGTAVLLWWRS